MINWLIIGVFTTMCVVVFSLPTDWARGYSLKRGIAITLIILVIMALHRPIIFLALIYMKHKE